MKIKELNGDLIISEIENFALADTLDCGQAFRWEECSNGLWQGVAFGRYLKLGITDKGIILYNQTIEDYENVWKSYFDFERDYKGIIKILSADETLKKACGFASGIRILRQDAWETLCSFIISQNNNIPRIKGIINRLCESFGDELENGFFSFPSAERIAKLSLEDLAPLRSGFRAKYILDAAKRVASGEIDLLKISKYDTDLARGELMKIYGVGAKVADCVLLFGMGHIDALPKDVWIKRVLETLYGGELPEYAREYAGIAQQYLFHYARMTKLIGE